MSPDAPRCRFVVAALVLALCASAVRAEDAPPGAATARLEPGELPASAPRAYVGIDLRSVGNLDRATSELDADLDLRVRWHGDFDPSAVAPANGVLASRELLERADEGPWHRIRWRVRGRFRQRFALERFPFDEQRLTIEVEHPGLHADALLLRPDPLGSRTAPDLVVPGFVTDRRLRAADDLVPDAGRGGAIVGDAAAELRSRVTFALDLRRPLLPWLARIFLPVAVALSVLVAAFLMSPALKRARGALALGSIASGFAAYAAVALAIPGGGTPTRADLALKLLLVGYGVIALAETAIRWSRRGTRARLARAVERTAHAVLPAGILLALVAIALPPRATASTPALALRDPPPSTRAELVMGLVREPTRLFAGRISTSDNLVTNLVVEPVVELDNRLNMLPRLVAELPSEENGLVTKLPDGRSLVRWRLDPGAFGDGTPIRAEDAVAAQALRPIPNAFVRLSGGDVLVEYDRPRMSAPLDLELFPHDRIAQFSSEDGRARFGNAEMAPLTGPFVLESWRRGEELVLARNPRFHRGVAALERIRVRTFKTKEDLGRSFVAGEVQLVPEGIFDPDEGTALAARVPGAEARRSMAPNWWHFDLCLDDPVLGDRRVRQALLLGLDREAMLRAVLGGHGKVSHTWLYPQHEGYLASVKRYPFDPARAAALLDEAGLARGPDGRRRAPDGSPVVLEVARAAKHPTAVAEFLSASLRPLGIGVRDRPYPDSSYFSDTLKRRRFRHLAYYGYTFDPTETGRDTWSMDRVPGWDNAWKGKNWTGWRNAEVTELHRRIDETLFEGERVELYERQQAIWADELPALPLYRPEQVLLLGKGLRGVVSHAGGDYCLPWNAEDWHFED